jgi:hypothetical protein
MSIHGYVGNIITANPTAPTVTSASGVWTTEQQLAAVSAGNWPGYEYPISRSLRFNPADATYLNRTFSTPTDNKKWTWSCWLKRSGFGGSGQYLIMTFPDGSNYAYINLTSSQTLELGGQTGGVNFSRVTSAVFRDPSAWYSVVVVADTTLATANDRIKIYVNNVLQVLTGTAPSQNVNLVINTAAVHRIGAHTSSANYYLDGYLTEINFIDGQALEPSSFGLNDPETGVWSPKRYTGTYGTNGFYLNFSDNSGTTSTTLGKDSSGNGNNWTPNNFSVTAGAGNDSMVDTPTAYGTDTGVGGEVRGNYCTVSPLSGDTNAVVSNGNLTVSGGTSSGNSRFGTFGVSSGKWYFEHTMTIIGANGMVAGVTTDVNQTTGTNGWKGYYFNGNKYDGATASAYGASFTTGDIIGVALNMDAGSITFYKNGVSQGVAFTGLTGTYFPLIRMSTSTQADMNFGQRAFAYTAPSGFKALCTTNLPTPTIGATSTTQANDYFNVVLWTGNSSASQAITGVGFQPDLVWAKARPANSGQNWVDAVRGATKNIRSSSADAEATVNTVISFQSDGFTVGDGNGYDINKSGESVVGWCWNAGGSNATNTSGTITSTVRANTTAGFSIVTYTGNSTSSQTVGHGLGVTPGMVIVKDRSSGTTNDWRVWHSGLTGGNNEFRLNTTAAQATDSTTFSSAPNATVINYGNNTAVNGSSRTYVAYVFAPVPGYSIFGSYASNNSADNAFVYCGFRPRWIMIKSSTTGGTNYDWLIFDTVRMSYNYIANTDLRANLTTSEGGTARNPKLDILSNGFKVRDSSGEIGSSTTYIFAAFAETPFKYALAR